LRAHRSGRSSAICLPKSPKQSGVGRSNLHHWAQHKPFDWAPFDSTQDRRDKRPCAPRDDRSSLNMASPWKMEKPCSHHSVKREACQGCHDPQQRSSGVLITDLSMVEMDRQLAALRRNSLLWSGGSIAVVLVVVHSMISRMVVSRLERFVKAITRVGEGDLDERVAIGGEDEIGELARAMRFRSNTPKLIPAMAGTIQIHLVTGLFLCLGYAVTRIV